MKVIDQINGSALFAQSAYSASIATKDSLGQDITATYLTGINIPESATWNNVSETVQTNSSTWNTVTDKLDTTAQVISSCQTGLFFNGIYYETLVSGLNGLRVSAEYAGSANIADMAVKDYQGNTIIASYAKASALPSYEYDVNNKISAINGSALAGGEGDAEVNSFVHNNSATINEVNTTYQANSGSYQPSGNYIPYTAVDTGIAKAFETNSGLKIKTQDVAGLKSTRIDPTIIQLSYISNGLIVGDTDLTTNYLRFRTETDSAYVDREKIHTWDSATNYIQNNSATNDEVNTSYQTNSGTFLTAHQDLSNYYTTADANTLSSMLSGAIDYVSANAGKVYEGVSPIVVNNTEDKISADTWTFSAGSNVSFVDDNVNKITRIDCTVTGYNETVLYDSSALINSDKALGTTFQISEPVSNFERFRIHYTRFPWTDQSPCQQIQEFDSTVPVNNIVLHTTFATSTATNATWYDCAGTITDISGTTWKLNSCMQKQLPNGNIDASWFYLKPYKIIGINRKY